MVFEKRTYTHIIKKLDRRMEKIIEETDKEDWLCAGLCIMEQRML